MAAGTREVMASPQHRGEEVEGAAVDDEQPPAAVAKLLVGEVPGDRQGEQQIGEGHADEGEKLDEEGPPWHRPRLHAACPAPCGIRLPARRGLRSFDLS